MKRRTRTIAFLLTCSAVFVMACSSKKPADVPLDDRAKLFSPEQTAQLRTAQQKYRDNCKSALAVVTVGEIPRAEPGAFADDEFKEVSWPEWVDANTPKAFILYSRNPEIIQLRLNNRWMDLKDQLQLQDIITNRNRSMTEQHQVVAALIQTAGSLSDNCPQPMAQGWIKRQAYNSIDEAKETVQSYAYPKTNFLARWYYTLLFEPILNSFLLTLNLFDFAPWVIFLFPGLLVICLAQNSFSFIGKISIKMILKAWSWLAPAFVANHINDIGGTASFIFHLLTTGLRWVIGLPTYAVLCILVFWRPEDAVTATNHLYSWIPAQTLNHLPVRGLGFVPYEFLASSGLLVGTVYFVAESIKLAFAIWGEIQFAEMDEEERSRFGVLGRWYGEYQENEPGTIAEEYIKRVWKLVFFSIVISIAPLALSLYFVVKAVYDASGKLISVLMMKFKVRIPAIIRYAPHVAATILLLVAYLHLATRSPANASASSGGPAVTEVSNALQKWAATTKARDLDAYMSCYTDPLERYYAKSNYSLAKVRADISRAFSLYATLDLQLTNVNVTVDSSGNRATANFTKTWNFQGKKSFSGSTQETAWMVKRDGRWLIIGIRDA